MKKLYKVSIAKSKENHHNKVAESVYTSQTRKRNKDSCMTKKEEQKEKLMFLLTEQVQITC